MVCSGFFPALPQRSLSRPNHERCAIFETGYPPSHCGAHLECRAQLSSVSTAQALHPRPAFVVDSVKHRSGVPGRDDRASQPALARGAPPAFSFGAPRPHPKRLAVHSLSRAPKYAGMRVQRSEIAAIYGLRPSPEHPSLKRRRRPGTFVTCSPQLPGIVSTISVQQLNYASTIPVQ